MTISELYFGLARSIPVVVALVLVAAANVPRRSRQQQYLMPAVAALYALVGMLLFYRFNMLLESLVDAVVSRFPFLEGVYQPSQFYVVENAAFLLLFLPIKGAYTAIARRVFNGSQFFGSSLVGVFYTFDAPAGRWFVKEEWSQTRKLLQVLAWASGGLTVAYIVAMYAFPSWPGFMVAAFPSVAALVVVESFCALNGLTFVEAKSTLAGERDDAERIANYAALRKVFADTFPERVLDEGVDLTTTTGLVSNAAIRELSQSDEVDDRVYAEYFESLKQSGKPIDENLVYASLGILSGTSVLINNPFYHDLTDYLAFPAYVTLLGGGKVLVVVGRDGAAEDVVEWMREGLQDVSGVPDLWNVEIVDSRHKTDLDVGVIRAGNLHDLELLRANDDFFGDVRYVIVSEPSRILIAGQLGMGLVVNRCSRTGAPTFAAFDRNHDGMVDSLSHLLKVNITDVVATQASQGASSDIVWKPEGGGLNGPVAPAVARYLGVGTELGALALKYHVSEVRWVGGSRFPVVDMNWIAGQYFEQMSDFAELELSQRALTTSLLPEPNPLELAQSRRRFLIVEDEFWNVYESLRMFETRSTESGFVNLISEEYLLRDYMTGNRDLFAADPKVVPSLVPDTASTERNTVLQILLQLSVFGMRESELAAHLDALGYPFSEEDCDPAEPSPRVAKLSELTAAYTGVELPVLNRTRRFTDEDKSEAFYELPDDNAPNPAIWSLGPAFFVVEDGAHQKHFVGACMRGHVSQTVLPGQFLTYGGKYYEVVDIDQGESGEVRLRRAAEHITGRPAYRPLRTLALSDVSEVPRRATVSGKGGVRLTAQSATVEVVTEGYMNVPNRSALLEARTVTIDGVPERTYRNKEVLRVEFPGAPPEVLATIAVLLNELFVTLFPVGHEFVMAASPGATDLQQVGLLPTLRTLEQGTDETEVGAVYIVEDSQVDLGLTIAIERNWDRILNIVVDYLDWNQSPEPVKLVASPDVVRFASDTDDSLAARAQRIAEAEASGGLPEVVKLPWWRRAWLKVKKSLSALGRRKKKATQREESEPAEELGAAEELDAAEEMGTFEEGGPPESESDEALEGETGGESVSK